MLQGLLEVVATGCETRGMLRENNIEGVNIAGPTMGVVPGVGVAGLRRVRNNVCIKLSGNGGFSPIVAGVDGGPAGLGVPIKSDSGNAGGTPCVDV